MSKISEKETAARARADIMEASCSYSHQHSNHSGKSALLENTGSPLLKKPDMSPAHLKVITPKRTYELYSLRNRIGSPAKHGQAKKSRPTPSPKSTFLIVNSPSMMKSNKAAEISKRSKAVRCLTSPASSQVLESNNVADFQPLEMELSENCVSFGKDGRTDNFCGSNEKHETKVVSNKPKQVLGNMSTVDQSGNLIRKRKLIQKCVLWPNNITFMFLHTLHKMADFRKRISELEDMIDEEAEIRKHFVCKSGIGQHKSAFTKDTKFSFVSIGWLQSRASLPTRAFVCELMRVLFDVSEIRNRSATGNLPPNGKFDKDTHVIKEAVDAAKRNFIYEKVREKYSELSDDALENELRFVNMHISSVCNQYSKVKNDTLFKRSRYGDPNENEAIFSASSKNYKDKTK